MDVAKYIGLFLLKNQFCYIHGLGNLELRKKSASYDGDTLQSPTYEVVVTPAGSIDDNLANFIATNEQISISKASNALRDFSSQARADLQSGKDVMIPNIGTFTEANGKIRFITDPHLHYAPPGIPTLRNSKRIEDNIAEEIKPKIQTPVYNPQNATARISEPERNSVNWVRVISAVVLLLLIIAGIGYGFKYYRSHNNQPAATLPPVIHTQDTAVTVAKADTARKMDSTAAITTSRPNADSPQIYRMIIGDYTTRAKAAKRAKTLSDYGHVMEVVAEDSTMYYVLMSVKSRPSDTARAMDSISHIFNPSGVNIYYR